MNQDNLSFPAGNELQAIPSESPKVSRRIIFAITLLTLAGNFAWMVENQYYNVYLYNVIAPRPLYISLMVAITAVVSTVTSITMGAFSDSIGKRKPFFIVGFVFWPIFTAIFPLARLFIPMWSTVLINFPILDFLEPALFAVLIAILFDSIMSFFGAMATDAALNAYSKDVTTVQNRAKIGGILELGLLVGTLVTYGTSGFIIDAWGYDAYFFIIGGLVAIFGIPGAFLAVESPRLIPNGKSTWQNLKSTFQWREFRQHKDAFLVLLISMFWGIGFQVSFSFLIIYLQHNIGLSIIQSSLLMFIALLIAIMGSIPIGKLIDKWGRKRICAIAIIGESIMLILFAISGQLLVLFGKGLLWWILFVSLAITGTLWVFLMMVFDISNQTWMKDLFPEQKTAQFCGYWVLFKVLLTMAPGSLLGGWISEKWGTPFYPEDMPPGFIPPYSLFIVGGLLILLSLIPLSKAKDISRQENSK